MKLGVTTFLTAALLALPTSAGATVVDLANAPGSLRFDGQAPQDHGGGSVANAGDVNGDGHPDAIVGAPQADEFSSNGGSGSAYVVYGGQALAGVKHRQLGSDGFRIRGEESGDRAGWAVAAAGDVNGDGIDDVIVGAPGANPGGNDSAGAAYVIYGQQTPDLPNVDLSKLKTTQAARGMEINGAAFADGVGFAVGGGPDLNFDQVSDVIVGAPTADNNDRRTSGSTYVVYGQQTADPADVDLTKIDNAQADRGMEIDGAAINDLSGFAVALSRDLNDDGIADALVGAPGAGNNMRGQSGSVYVIYGMNGDDLPDVDLAKISTTQAASGMRIDGVGVLDGLGQSVAGGPDLNGDGIGDAIVGAPRNHNDAGAAYVVYGRTGDPADLDLAKLTTTQAGRGMRITGAIGGIETGWAVSSGRDVNRDGRPDAIVGARDASFNGRTVSGSAYVVYGRRAADPTDVNLAKITTTQHARGLRIDGAARGDRVGSAVAGSAGDLNGDGRADVIVGAPEAHNNGAGSGSAYILDF